MEKTLPTTTEVVDKLREILVGFQVDGAKVTPEAGFEALGLDSLDVVERSVKVEDAYDIEIDEDDLKEATTVGLAAELVIRKLRS